MFVTKEIHAKLGVVGQVFASKYTYCCSAINRKIS